MLHSQLLSPIATATRNHCSASRHVNTADSQLTHVRPHSDTVLDASGTRMTWDAAMRGALKHTDAAVSVHPAIEVVEMQCSGDIISPVQLGARAASAIPCGSFLGFYQGWLGTSIEASRTLQERTPLVAAACALPSTISMLERASAELHFRSYVAMLIEVQSADEHAPDNSFIVAPVAPDGRYIGNALSRINDGRAAPYAQVSAGDVDSESTIHPSSDRSALLDSTDLDELSCGGSARDRPPNCRLVTIYHGDWIYLGMQTIADLPAGEELLCDYGECYWEGQRIAASRVLLLRRQLAMCARCSMRDWVSSTLLALRWLRAAERHVVCGSSEAKTVKMVGAALANAKLLRPSASRERSTSEEARLPTMQPQQQDTRSDWAHRAALVFEAFVSSLA